MTEGSAASLLKFLLAFVERTSEPGRHQPAQPRLRLASDYVVRNDPTNGAAHRRSFLQDLVHDLTAVLQAEQEQQARTRWWTERVIEPYAAGILGLSVLVAVSLVVGGAVMAYALGLTMSGGTAGLWGAGSVVLGAIILGLKLVWELGTPRALPEIPVYKLAVVCQERHCQQAGRALMELVQDARGPRESSTAEEARGLVSAFRHVAGDNWPGEVAARYSQQAIEDRAW